jgi:2,4-dienoyl-CoA reductase-like NADH-dependent reductase (Old Yellow Enzyme family)
MPNDPSQRPLPLLFTPLTLRGVRLKNRVVISPMCQYSADDGCANDWHLVHLGQFATGGAGLVFVEATAVQARGRITHGDMGLWKDEQIAPLKRITDFLKAHGCVPGIQIGHAGRKASMQRPWFGNGPLAEADFARGDKAWDIVAPSAEPIGEGWIKPQTMTLEDITQLTEDFRATTRRAVEAGFDALEIHGAHGYLLHSFCSPLTNKRDDEYGGPLGNRIRLSIETAAAVRAVWPSDKPLFYRVSATDFVDRGWTLEDSVTLANALKTRGVDVIDCSAGGIAGSATAAGIKRYPGFQVPFAERIRAQSGLKTQAVGIILDGTQAEEILQKGQADLIAVARQALHDPHWALHAAQELGADSHFAFWPKQYGWWLDARAKTLSLQKA